MAANSLVGVARLASTGVQHDSRSVVSLSILLRRYVGRALVGIALLVPSLVLGAMSSAPASAQGLEIRPAPKPEIVVIEITGLLDTPTADFVEDMLTKAEKTNNVGAIIQINSRGGTLSAERFQRLRSHISESHVPIGIWIGPTNGRAYGQAVDLLGAADSVGMAEGARVGFPDQPVEVQDGSIETQNNFRLNEATAAGVVNFESPTLPEFLAQFTRTAPVTKANNGTMLTADDIVPLFTKPPIALRILHSVITPGVSEFFILGGGLLLLFEFFAAGAGVVGVCGAVLLALGSYGAAEVGVRPVGIVLLVAAAVSLSSDLQAGVVRLRAAFGIVLMIAGSLTLYERFEPSLLAHTVIILPTAAFAILGIPVMIRTRFSVASIDRSPLKGSSGAIQSALSPKGVAVLDGVEWAAKGESNQRSVPVGSAVNVVSVEGHQLVVARQRVD